MEFCHIIAGIVELVQHRKQWEWGLADVVKAIDIDKEIYLF
jgi:hypothetical protein